MPEPDAPTAPPDDPLRPALQESVLPPEDAGRDFGRPGRPVNRASPFYLGFVGAFGVLIAVGLWHVLGALSQVFTLMGIAAFLAMGLDPVVRAVQRWLRLSRGWAVLIVLIAVLAVFTGFGALIFPTVISQATQLGQAAPDLVNQLLRARWVERLNNDYGVITKITTELQSRLTKSDTVIELFGGVLGAGRAVVSGLFSTITVLVLTLYFLASLRTITEAGYRLVPASRRERVRLLGDEIIRRIGGYVAGQVSVATINGVCSLVMMWILGLPYAIVLAVVVGVLGLIPMVGATLGAIIVALVALFQSWQTAVIVVAYYVIYQQIENYLISPRVMARTVAVPGAVALIAALAGGTLLGVLGALIAVPIAAAVLLILDQVVLPRQEAH